MKFKWKIVTLGVLLGILSLASLSPSQAAPVWSETFSGGVLPPDWTVYEGDFTCANYRLEGHSGVDFNEASRDSAVAVGTWNFTVYGRVIILFMASDLDPSTDWPNDSYGFAYDPTLNAWRLIRHTGGAFAPLRRSYEHTDGSPVSVAITRNTTDFIHVWINNDQCMIDQDPTHSTSQYFFVQCQEGAWIDNIVVSNTVDLDWINDSNGPLIGGIDPVLLAAALGVVAVVIIIVVAFVVIRRRK